MSICVIVEQARAQPDDLAEPKIGVETLLDLFAGEGVAIGIEEALLCSDDDSRSVAIDRSAFEDPVRLFERKSRIPSKSLADVVVARELILTAPTGEAETLGPTAAACLEHDRPSVAQPDVAEGFDDDLGERRECSRTLCSAIMSRDQPNRLASAVGVNRFRKSRNLAFGWLEITQP